MSLSRSVRAHIGRASGFFASTSLVCAFLLAPIVADRARAEEPAGADAPGAAKPVEDSQVPQVAAPAAEEAEAHPRVSIGSSGFKVESADGRYSFDIGGRVQVDGTAHIGTVDLSSDDTSEFYYANGAAPVDGAQLRRARIETTARAGDFPFVGEVDFADDQVGVKDFWVGYDGLDWLTIMVGTQKQPYSLVIEESSNDISFMERGILKLMKTPKGDFRDMDQVAEWTRGIAPKLGVG